jgi:hypothetical protein
LGIYLGSRGPLDEFSGSFDALEGDNGGDERLSRVGMDDRDRQTGAQ